MIILEVGLGIAKFQAEGTLKAKNKDENQYDIGYYNRITWTGQLNNNNSLITVLEARSS